MTISLASGTETALVQRRTLRLLFATQIVSGMGVAIGSSVGALLAADLAGVGLSGLAQSASVVGGALAAIPATAIVHRHGRRPSLAAAYGVAAVGALLVVLAAVQSSLPLLFLGFFLFGGATAANLQARYAAVDLAPAALRGRHLSLIVWATTIGAVAGPHLAAPAGVALSAFGIPTLAAPYFFSALLFIITGLAVFALLRPDPALVAGTAGADSGAHRSLRAGLSAIIARAPADAPAKPMIRSDNPCADARRSSGTDSVSSVEPATIVHDQPSPTANSPAARRTLS